MYISERAYLLFHHTPKCRFVGAEEIVHSGLDPLPKQTVVFVVEDDSSHGDDVSLLSKRQNSNQLK